MKKTFWAFILFFPAVLAFSQTRIGALVYVDVANGTPEERRFFDRNLRMEVIAAGYTVTDDILAADYALTCSITNAASGSGHVLELTLFDVEGETDIVSTDLAYEVKEDTYETLQPVLRSMFASAPLKEVSTEYQLVEVEKTAEAPAPPDAWKRRWVFLNMRAGISSRYYLSTVESMPSTSIITFDAGLEPEIHVLHVLAIQLGLDIALDRAEYQRSPANPAAIVYSTSVLSIPFMVKYIFNPSDRFTLGPYMGGYGTFPLLGASIPPPFGALAGVDFGIKTGSGILFFDLRYSVDLGSTDVPEANLSYNRTFITLSAGYRLGLIQH